MAELITREDLLTRIGNNSLIIRSDSDGVSSSDLEKIDQAIESAIGIVEAYVRVQYSEFLARLPLLSQSDVPEVLRGYTLDIAAYVLPTDICAVDELSRKRYDDALAWLDLLCTGKVKLPIEEENRDGANRVRLTAEKRKFTRTTLRDLF